MKEAKEDHWKHLDLFLGAVIILIVLGVAFQFFGRYAYVNTKGSTVVRIDRLSGERCTVPCDPELQREMMFVAPEPSPTDVVKVCHPANVVRVAGAMRIPPHHQPVTYLKGGFESGSPVRKHWKRNVIPDAAELSDGHVYAFSDASFVAVDTWATGQDVEVCATWSKIENRPFYSVGAADAAEPATIAI